jgi:hypothetical protein
MDAARRERIEGSPCWGCLDPRPREILHSIAQGGVDLDDDRFFTPSGPPNSRQI